MKRSEMVRKMTEHWLGLFPNEKFEDEELQEEVKENMSRLLRFIEDCGMPPPFVEKTYIAHAQTSFPVSGYEWEKEDE
jgi:hypothetical protein